MMKAQGDRMEKREDFFIPEEIAEWIGLKKSEYLSKLIQNQPSHDFKFEEFHLYDGHIPTTIENPDKAYEYQEEEHTLRTYLRTYNEKVTFHQVVIGVLVDDKRNQASVFVPILCFVSKDDALIREFTHGEVITRPTLN
jgi:DNA-directed RNA polymerase specialized sigma subunit